MWGFDSFVARSFHGRLSVVTDVGGEGGRGKRDSGRNMGFPAMRR
jgi:hypothetical protein